MEVDVIHTYIYNRMNSFICFAYQLIIIQNTENLLWFRIFSTINFSEVVMGHFNNLALELCKPLFFLLYKYKISNNGICYKPK